MRDAAGGRNEWSANEWPAEWLGGGRRAEGGGRRGGEIRCPAADGATAALSRESPAIVRPL